MARDTVADTTAVTGHHFSGWWVALAVALVVIAVGVFLWRSQSPPVVDNSRR